MIGARIAMMSDEGTAHLTFFGINLEYSLIFKLKKIDSHRLDEIYRVTDSYALTPEDESQR